MGSESASGFRNGDACQSVYFPYLPSLATTQAKQDVRYSERESSRSRIIEGDGGREGERGEERSLVLLLVQRVKPVMGTDEGVIDPLEPPETLRPDQFQVPTSREAREERGRVRRVSLKRRRAA